MAVFFVGFQRKFLVFLSVIKEVYTSLKSVAHCENVWYYWVTESRFLFYFSFLMFRWKLFKETVYLLESRWFSGLVGGVLSQLCLPFHGAQARWGGERQRGSSCLGSSLLSGVYNEGLCKMLIGVKKFPLLIKKEPTKNTQLTGCKVKKTQTNTSFYEILWSLINKLLSIYCKSVPGSSSLSWCSGELLGGPPAFLAMSTWLLSWVLWEAPIPLCTPTVVLPWKLQPITLYCGFCLSPSSCP